MVSNVHTGPAAPHLKMRMKGGIWWSFATALSPQQSAGNTPRSATLSLSSGSAPAIYYRKANTTADPTADKKWVLYFKGGGWCTDPAGCLSRAGGLIGSSKELEKSQPTFTFTGQV